MNKLFTESRIDDLIELYKNDLLNDIIPFWLNKSIDREDGGFMFSLDRKGEVIDTDKGVWQTGRFTWMLATLYNEISQNKEWLNAAKHGINFLENHCFDTDGRMFFLMDKKGNPVRKRRYLFSESFAAIAFAAYSKATGDLAYAEKARLAFQQFIKYTSTPGLIAPKFTNHRQMKGMGVPMIGIVTAQELRKNLNDASYTELITNWIEEIKSDFINEKYRAVMETVGPNGEFLDHFDGRTL
ncbi:MAG: AGE family epimerase/isomerase, partial [Cyclobacteriaceae bacterium]|nr:AGE family epimerase/isomerase [Cyclobacteriaceae bacterium]